MLRQHRKCFGRFNIERTQWRSALAGRFFVEGIIESKIGN